MRKLFLTLLFVIVAITTTFSQSFIGASKKEILNELKPKILKSEESKKESDGSYNLVISFAGYSGSYTFTKDDYCCFIVMWDTYSYADYKSICMDYDDKYLRVFPVTGNEKPINLWKEWTKGIFVYRWIVINDNSNTYYLIILTKSDYEANRDAYLFKIFGK